MSTTESVPKRRRRSWILLLAAVVVLAGGVAAAVLLLRGPAKPTVPAALVPLIERAAKTCPAVSPSLLAGQLYTESRFEAKAVSSAGAMGVAQFTPDTWAEFGVDGNGDGVKDVYDPADAIPAQARYDCYLAKQTASVPGDPTRNMLAAYNAGPGAVAKHQGVPPFAETQGYVTKVEKYAAEFRYLDTTASGSASPSGRASAKP
ncbi:lytic transglycosylase domain-containing protein [Kitasatospora sp. MMS16-BH015]|uniref:lytic transglycosylase domain-containing protein n=1 Tax=Kitasatospora sp. MMS16-BH015 TaxID=2018025 RepID=UPI000CF2795A|nr:lytic transglycosylase domain-containing protein [Kitasatospora sp. MMS16-BH015]